MMGICAETKACDLTQTLRSVGLADVWMLKTAKNDQCGDFAPIHPAERSGFKFGLKAETRISIRSKNTRSRANVYDTFDVARAKTFELVFLD